MVFDSFLAVCVKVLPHISLCAHVFVSLSFSYFDSGSLSVSLCCSVLLLLPWCTAVDRCDGPGEPKQLSGKVGGSITLPTGVKLKPDDLVVWSCGSDHDFLLTYNDGDLNMGPKESFSGRLHFDPETGSLSISSLHINDINIYCGQIFNGNGSSHKFSVSVHSEYFEA